VSMIVDLISALPRAECEKRLRQHVSSEWSLVTDAGVVGSIDGDGFRLRKKIYYRNSFQKHLYGVLSDAPGGGTAIHCEAREMDLRWVFILAGVIAALAFAGVALVLLTHRAQLHDVPLAAIAGPLMLIPILTAVMIGAVAFGRYISRNEPLFLVAFLKRTLEAKDA
jgi:hypothetical protein